MTQPANGAQGITKPTIKPARPYFSSGPCAKPPGWNVNELAGAVLGRSHRAGVGKAKLKAVIDQSKAILGMPDDWKLGIVPASDTGAVEMALWSLLGPKGVDAIGFESFGEGWVSTIQKQLKIDDLRVFKADYGALPKLEDVDTKTRDVVLTWNGTTSGVVIPNGDWIADKRDGLVIVDATSAVFAYDLPWHKLDVVTWSWQKVMGGEAAHGMIALSPQAVARLESHTPSWPMPKIFRLTKGGKLIDGIFAGETINTPSLLCVEDALFGLNWAKQNGGLAFLQQRTKANLQHVTKWVAQNDWVDFLARDAAYRSSTSICLKLSDHCPLSGDARDGAPKAMAKLLEQEGIAFDIGSYRDAPNGFRLWGGATIDPDDMAALLPWLSWAYQQIAA